MITDPGDILKIQGGFDKLADAEEKFCTVAISPTTDPEDRTAIRTAVSNIGTQKQAISLLIPTESP